ncbi:MAG: nucleotidyltransferase domain-containing protein [Acidimicrobiia bacterium]|nr:nucleotidyltransferase domain-containing protein [Acidimicrobiia bacterium]
MNLGNPINSVIPGARGEVLAVLARTERPLSGRRVAALTGGRVSQTGANLALRSLVASGLVLVEAHPPANLYRLNRLHLAASCIETIATLPEQVVDAIRAHLEVWPIPAWGAWLFGSAARGDGNEASDIDVVIVRPDEVDDGDPDWLDHVDRLAADVTAWTGNKCEVVEYGIQEFEGMFDRSDRLASELRADGVALTSRRLPRGTPIERTRR